MASKSEAAIPTPITDSCYSDLEDYFEKVLTIAAKPTRSRPPPPMLAQVIQLNQLEMLHGKHLVDEASCAPRPFSPTHNHDPPHSSLSYNPLATRLLSDISSQKTVIRFHPQFQAMPDNDVTTPPRLPCSRASPAVACADADAICPQVAFLDAFMNLYAPDDGGIWFKVCGGTCLAAASQRACVTP